MVYVADRIMWPGGGEGAHSIPGTAVRRHTYVLGYKVPGYNDDRYRGKRATFGWNLQPIYGAEPYAVRKIGSFKLFAISGDSISISFLRGRFSAIKFGTFGEGDAIHSFKYTRLIKLT